jgi:hypothetical protein
MATAKSTRRRGCYPTATGVIEWVAMITQNRLKISSSHLREVNDLLGDSGNRIVGNILAAVDKYGTPAQINRKAKKNSSLPVILGKLKRINPEYGTQLQWLQERRDAGAFVTIGDYRRSVLGQRAGQPVAASNAPVVLEISALQYFPWLITEARQAIERRELMPGRFIRVRKMKEQEADGDLLAVSAAMQILGASIVETLDTKGTDGSNVHLGGPDTITGYFGGIGEPNGHVLKWVDEFLYYYTNYGVQEVLNINPGTILAGYLLYKLGVDIKFKISVFMGNDNPYAALWTMIGAKLFSRRDGTTPLIGFNWSNSVDNETLELASACRKHLGFEENIRFEHHIVEAYRHIVRQPYDRRAELMDVAKTVPNISAKHEGGEVDVEKTRDHSSSILDYFIDKQTVMKDGLMPALERNYLDKHESVNITAKALTERGLPFTAAAVHS